jgi:hypothetical protein
MRIPQTAERIKEAPAQALRAVFAGVGQVLLVTERVRRRALGGDEGARETSRPAAPVSVVTGETAATAGTTAPTRPAAPTAPTAPTEVKPAAAEAAGANEAAEVSAAGPAKAAQAPAAAPQAPAEDAGGLPVPHYSQLSIASLRARMRGLDVGQVRELLSYERAHEDRENVVAMFERRIAKLEEAGDAG